ncbi:MAG: sigma-54 dependent transcriptional regulator, partial [Planctomycetota bacterium]
MLRNLDVPPLPSMQARILVIDDSGSRDALTDALTADSSRSWSMESCSNPEQLSTILDAQEPFDVLLCDTDLVDPAHLEEILSALPAERPRPAWIALKSFGSIQDAVETVRAGASDYLSKPTDPDRLSMAVEKALESRALLAENARLRADLEGRYEFGRIQTRDPAMRSVFDTARAVADARATVLIEGESGTGKTLLARTIHQASARASEPFVEVNCGALPESLLESELFGHVRGAFTGAVRDKAGKFEQADGGTLFLDEIGTAPLELQVKLLRVLQDRVFERVGGEKTLSVDVRVLAATNANLNEEVAAGRFREDLY